MIYAHCIHTQIPRTFITEHIRAEKATYDHAHHLDQIISEPQIQEVYNTIDKASFTNVSSQLSIIHNQWQQYGYGLYIIFDKETSDFIGFAGYHTVIIDEQGTVNCFYIDKLAEELELYIFLMPHYWHRGYGFEVTAKLVELAFKHLSFTSIIAYIEPTNHASLRLIKKLHFAEEKQVMYNNKLHILYRLSKQ
jgi:RimJ/RimL family protein N-acetyltransferase